jgi:hypothetical protein
VRKDEPIVDATHQVLGSMVSHQVLVAGTFALDWIGGMMDDYATPVVQNVRRIAEDMHHDLAIRAFIERANALRFGLEQARESGMAPYDCDRIASAVFEDLLTKGPGGRLGQRRRQRRVRRTLAGSLTLNGSNHVVPGQMQLPLP